MSYVEVEEAVDPTVDDEGEDRPRLARIEHCFPCLPNLRSGLVAFGLFAGFALTPLGRYVDRTTDLRPLRPRMEAFPFVRDFLDHVASQGGEGLVMAAVAVALTLFMRSSLPLVVGVLTEVLFYVTGLAKLLFAKDAPRFGTPSYWAGGYLAHGKFGMAFPSGHTTEVMLVFGSIVLMLHIALPAWSARRRRTLKAIWVAVAVNASVVSWALGTHWLTDLVGGLLFGGVMLRLLQLAVSRGAAPTVAAWIDGRIAAGLQALRPSG